MKRRKSIVVLESLSFKSAALTRECTEASEKYDFRRFVYSQMDVYSKKTLSGSFSPPFIHHHKISPLRDDMHKLETFLLIRFLAHSLLFSNKIFTARFTVFFLV